MATEPLIQRAQRGDPDAVADLYEMYVERIFRYVSYRVESRADAEDLTADVFVKMVEGLPAYRHSGAPFEAWLYRIASARIIDARRKSRRRPQAELQDDLAVPDGTPLEDALGERERLAELRDALDHLTSEQQLLLVLRFVERKSHEQVAEIMGKSLSAVRSIQHRALTQLAALLGESKGRHYLRGRRMRDPLDPGQLSDALDRHLPPGSDHVLPDQPDDPAVMAASRLASSPKPALDPAARARMKAQVMAAVPRSAPGGPRPILRIAVFALVSAAVMAAALLGLFAVLNIGPTSASPTPAGVAVVVETGTPSDTPTSTPPTSTPPTPVTSTPPPAPSDTPASTAERAARITLEGVVEAIDDRRLTISGLEVELVEDDPLLDVLRVNDRVRIEGKLVRGARMFNIWVETFVLANDDAAENLVETGPDGDLWRDPGGCDNPPPPWAKAYGWRARCEGGGTSGGGQGSSDRPNSSRDSRASDAQDDDD